jgi:hypothetical protein
MNAQPGDVIQLDPSKTQWGPVVCVVSDLHAWGVTAYWLSFNTGQTGPVTIKATGAAYVRVSHGDYVVVGQAAWLMAEHARLTGNDADA